MKVRGLRVNFDHTQLFDGLDLDFAEGSYTLICGPTGCGKSSLVLALTGGLQASVSGEITGGPAAVVWQDPGAQLCGRTVLDEVRLPMDYSNVPAEESTRRARELLVEGDLAGVEPGRDPVLLSGGQQQRLVLAAGLAQDCPVLILDEATSQLDQAGRARFEAAVQSQPHRTIIAIDHDPTHHLPRADRVIVLGEGGVVRHDGPTLPDDPASFGIRAPGSTLPKHSSRLGNAETEIDLGFGSFPLGSVVAVVGANGSGKSTLLRQLARRRDLLRHGVAWVPQRGAHYLLRDTVAGELDAGPTSFTPAEAGLTGCEQLAPLSLSGGQRQRLALAHALGGANLSLALLDEPSYSQDLAGTRQVIELITRDVDRRVTLIASHDQLLIDAIATHVATMADGEVRQVATC